MATKSPDLVSIEKAFASIKSNPKGNQSSELATIKRVLSRRYDIDVELNVVDNKGLDFFGMSVFPESDLIDKMVQSLINDKAHIDTVCDLWAKNKKWVIDIDSHLLYDAALNANPTEITAVLLHEIGHVIKSNSVPTRVSRIIRYTEMHATMNVKRLTRWKKVHKIIGLAFIEGATLTNYKMNLAHEKAADRLPLKEGYGEDLSQFIGKLVSKKGNRLVDRTEEQMDQDIEAVVQWGLGNISQLEYRKNVLDRNIQAQLLMTHSKYVRTYLLDIRKAFFGKEEDKYNRMVTEQYVLKEYQKYTATNESFRHLFDKNGRIQKVTSQEIDYVIIEANRIQTENDRIYVLDLIYSKLDVIELSMDMLSNPDTASKVLVSKDTLKRQKEELLNLRRQVMSLKLRTKDYTLVVNYPAGYEG